MTHVIISNFGTDPISRAVDNALDHFFKNRQELWPNISAIEFMQHQSVKIVTGHDNWTLIFESQDDFTAFMLRWS